MKHIGATLKAHIENNGLKKGKIAEAAGISYNYLSTIFKQDSCDAELLERLYTAAGLSPCVVFDGYEEPHTTNSEIAPAIPQESSFINQEQEHNADALLAEREKVIAEKERIIIEKERTIQILLGNLTPAFPSQNRATELQ